MIKSTSLPVGVIEGAVCERCIKKFYKNDIIVMVSDGVLESIIFENKDDYLRDILSDMEYDNPEDVVEYILEKVKSIGGSRFKDDATIIVCKLVKTLWRLCTEMLEYGIFLNVILRKMEILWIVLLMKSTIT